MGKLCLGGGGGERDCAAIVDYIISIITVAGNRAAGAAVRAGENDEK